MKIKTKRIGTVTEESIHNYPQEYDLKTSLLIEYDNGEFIKVVYNNDGKSNLREFASALAGQVRERNYKKQKP